MRRCLLHSVSQTLDACPFGLIATCCCRTGVSYGQRLAAGIHVIEEVPITQGVEGDGRGGNSSSEERRAAISHTDAVLHMTELHSFGERLLLSGGADGVVKAWK